MFTAFTLIEESKECCVVAKLLADNQHYKWAVYIAGYSIEFSLKALICKRKGFKTYPDEQSKYKKHDFNNLVNLADLRSDLKEYQDSNLEFQVNWSLTTDWSPDLRYEQFDPASSESRWLDFYDAITNEDSGVIVWLHSLI
ncbi:MAG: HEPN domain-containing protein [Ruminococcaceae bacterium]|nr:HEPN domain-containing protein [Oscillospiraceae bacterium]